jgi:hypothetical protein
VIVRISGEDQYRLDDSERDALSQLEDGLADVVESGREDDFEEALTALLEFVRSHGELVDDDDLVGSDYILPPPDATFSEVSQEFTGEGLIPD